MKMPPIQPSLYDLEARVKQMESLVQAQKAIIIALIAISGDKAEQACLVVRDEAADQSEAVAEHIDRILASIHRPDREHH